MKGKISFAGTFCAALFLLNIVCSAAGAGADITVTAVTLSAASGENRAELTLNNAILIREVRLLTIGGRQALRFPEYVSRAKKVFPQVVLRTRQSRDAVMTAVATGRGGISEKPVRFEIDAFRPYRKRSSLKVLATVVFNGAVAIECKVIEGRNGPWIAWPARKGADGRWVDQVEITDKRLREAVEQDLLTKYMTSVAENDRETDP